MLNQRIGGEGKDRDPFTRYSRPRIVIKIERHKTVLVNLAEIGSALKRPAECIAAFVATTLGVRCLTKSTKQTKTRNHSHRNRQPSKIDTRYILSGQHDGNLIENGLRQFEQIFVLCRECKSPELTLDIDAGTKKLMAKCPASGHSYSIDHKFSAHLVQAMGKKNTTASGFRPLLLPSLNDPYFSDPDSDEKDTPQKWVSGTTEKDVQQRRDEERVRPSATLLLARHPHLARQPSPTMLWRDKPVVSICDILLYTPQAALVLVSEISGLPKDILSIIGLMMNPELVSCDPGWSYCPWDYDVGIGIDATSGDRDCALSQFWLACSYYRWMLELGPMEMTSQNTTTMNRGWYVLSTYHDSGAILVFQSLDNPQNMVSFET